RVRRELEELPVEVVTNPRYDGPSSLSLHAGIRALPRDVAGALVILPDMVHVSAEALRTVTRAARPPASGGEPVEAPPALVVSRYGGVNAPPVLFRRELFAELLA